MINLLCDEIGVIEELERLQSFIRLKVLIKPEIGKLFKFFEHNKKELRIEQYTIK